MVPDLVLIDQDRSPASAARLARLPRVRQVVQSPPCPDQVARLGHDHPAALNLAMSLPVETSHLMVVDSDSFPIDGSWLARLEARLDGCDAVVAADPRRSGLSHPCLMVLPVDARTGLDFAEGLLEVGIDTGRLVGLQLVRAGYRIHVDHPTAGFGGRRGSLYLDGTFYHHGSGSFAAPTADPIVRRQVQAPVEAFYRRKIGRDDLDLGLGERAFLRAATLSRQLRRRFR